MVDIIINFYKKYVIYTSKWSCEEVKTMKMIKVHTRIYFLIRTTHNIMPSK